MATRQTRRTILAAVCIWAAATLLQASVLAAQERLYFPYAFMGAATYFGVLGVLGWPAWVVCARVAERSWSRTRVAAIQLLMGVLVIAVWQAAYLGCLRLWMGRTGFTLRLREIGLWELLGSAGFYAAMIAIIIAVQTSRRLQAQLRRQSELQLLAQRPNCARSERRSGRTSSST
jgi:hypothetical protein